uniref:Transcription initiation factor TFIID subunit 4-like n=1 Tax=Hippocampus comes TaxID=109280 RepID=A0A3Q2XQY8_HIPCM
MLSPESMVLVRIETGQLVMVPQQVLAQAQAKTQQSPGLTAVPQRPAGPTAPTAIRHSGGGVQYRGTVMFVDFIFVLFPKAITVTSGAAGVSVKMAPPPKVQPALAAEVTTAAPTATAATVKPLAAEMQENVKKCKNFLATLIKLASNNSPSPDTSKNVKALVQDLLDAKIEPEEFTSRLQAELKSSPQPYLIPFLKVVIVLPNPERITRSSWCRSSPAMGRSTMQAVRAPIVVGVRTPGECWQVFLPAGVSVAPGQCNRLTALAFCLFCAGALMRGPAAMVGKSVVTLAAPANQKKLGDPGGGTFRDDDDINDVASMAGVNLSEENARILATSSELVGTKIRSCKDEAFLPAGLLHRRILDTGELGVSEVPLEVVNLVSHATQSRLRSLLEKVTALAQHRSDADEEHHEQTSDVRSQLRFFEQLERLEKQRKDEQEREILLKAAKSRARQEDPEQARLKQKAKEMQQQELAQMRQRDANLTALAAIGPRKKRKMDSAGGGGAVSSGSSAASSASSLSSPRQPWRQRITRVNLRDLIVCLEQDGSTARSLMLYKALLK